MGKFLLLFTLPFLALHAINLESFYHIDNNTLIDVQGKRFPALDFGSPLHEELTYRLKDPEQATIIHQAYQKHIVSILSEELVLGFSKALIKVSYFFGSRKLSPEKGFWIALREEGCLSWAEQNRQAIAAFISEANQSAHLPKKERREGPFTVAILTTTASGGNESVTYGIVPFLSAYKNIKTVVIDVETLAKEVDPIMLVSGVITYDGLYASIFQQKEDSDVLIQRDVVTKQLSKYIPSRLGSLLKEKLLEVNPDLIISTRSYSMDDLPLATLDIPFRMLHCDYELSFFLLDIYGKANPNAVKFWLPSMEPAVFKPLFVKANRLDLYDERDSQQKLIEKIALLMGITAEEVQKQFACIGYPTRPEFKRITDSKELESLRKKWDVQTDETPILISMGKNGVGTIEKIYDQLAKLPLHQWKFIFICGKNGELKTKLENRLSFANRVTICGFLSPEEMNELMNLSPVKITKPGGAVTTEALVTETYLLMMGSHPWEEANGSKIEKMGLGQWVQTDLSLEAQIEESLVKSKIARSRHSVQILDWKSLLLNELRAIAVSVDAYDQ